MSPPRCGGDIGAARRLERAYSRTGSDGADFIEIVGFDKRTAVCAEWLAKGREVAVVGKLRFSVWTGRDGECRFKEAASSSGRRRRCPAGEQ